MCRALALCRVSVVVHARLAQPRAWASPMSGVRVSSCARGYHHHAHHALVRSLYSSASRRRSAHVLSLLSLATKLPALAFAPLRRCTSAPLRALLFCSRLCCASALPHLRLCSAPLLSTALACVLLTSQPRLRLTRSARLLHWRIRSWTCGYTLKATRLPPIFLIKRYTIIQELVDLRKQKARQLRTSSTQRSEEVEVDYDDWYPPASVPRSDIQGCIHHGDGDLQYIQISGLNLSY